MRVQDKHITPRDEHARGILIEQDPTEDDDAAVIASYKAAQKTDEESFPAWVVEKLIVGNHPLKVFREYRGFTDEQLAQRTGAPLSLVRQIEARERQASEGELARFAHVLQVDTDDLS